MIKLYYVKFLSKFCWWYVWHFPGDPFAEKTPQLAKSSAVQQLWELWVDFHTATVLEGQPLLFQQGLGCYTDLKCEMGALRSF